MSITKYLARSRLLGSIIAVMAVAQLFTPSGRADDEILSYYLSRVESAIKARNPVLTGASYSFTAKSIYKHTNSHGRVSGVDSLEVIYYHSWGKLDSQKVITGDPTIFENRDNNYPDIFAQGYLYNTFPHDTGGTELAIGLDTPNADDDRPTGLLIIDRQHFNPLWLYLFYPQPAGHARLSQAWRFIELDGLLFVDSSWVVGAARGVFGFDHYRIETGISDITVDP